MPDHVALADRRAWLWLLLGGALLPFVSFQTILPLAPWLAPIFLLRFTRTQRAAVALPALAVVFYAAAVVSLRGVFPAPGLYLFALAAMAGVSTYAIDRVLARRLSGSPRMLVFPTASVVTDWLFGKSSLGTMGSSAYASFGDLPLMQLASVTGILGMVFLMSWLGAAVNEVWERGPDRHVIRRSVIPFVVVWLGVLLCGSARIAFFPPSASTVRIAALAADRELWHALRAPPMEVAHGNDEARAAARAVYAPIVDELFDRTAQQARAGARIIVWSEAAAFVLKEDELALVGRAAALARETGIYLEVALVVIRRADRLPFAENRALLFDPHGDVLWDYSKTYQPLGDASVFSPGPGVIPTADTPYGRLATVICFDADFPPLIRQAGCARVDILLVPANDWRPIHTLHARVAAFRAVENGCALVRSTGNGLAIAVDDLGQTLAAADYFATDRLTLWADVPTRGRTAIYARLGDWFPWLCSAALVGVTVSAFGRRSAVRHHDQADDAEQQQHQAHAQQQA